MRRTLEKYGLCLLLSVVMFFVVGCERGGNGAESSADEETVQDEIDTAQEDQAIQENIYEQEPSEEVAIDTASQADREQSEQIGDSSKKWHIVISSMPSRQKAEQFAERRSPGAEVIYIDYIDTYRVVHSSYDDLRAAQNGFESLQNDFPDAWLVRF